jgi:hypothetical protein
MEKIEELLETALRKVYSGRIQQPKDRVSESDALIGRFLLDHTLMSDSFLAGKSALQELVRSALSELRFRQWVIAKKDTLFETLSIIYQVRIRTR